MRRYGLPAGLLLAVFLLRLPTVIGEWGLPSADEFSWIGRNIAPMLLGDLNPRLFEYPAGVVFTLVAAVYDLVYRVGHALSVYGTRDDFVALMRADPWPFCVIGRLLMLSGGLMGVVAVHRLALRVAESHVAVWAAVAYGLTIPFTKLLAIHYVDVLVAPCLLAALCLCLDIREGRRDTRTLVLCGVLLGTMINLKIPYAPCVIAVAAALWLAPDRARRLSDRAELSRFRPALILCALGAGVVAIARTLAVPASYDPRLALGVGAVGNFARSVKLVGLLAMLAGVAALALPPVRRVMNAALLSRTFRVTALTAAVTFLAWSPYYFADPVETVMGVMRMMRTVDWEVGAARPPTFHLTIVQRTVNELLGLPMGLLGLAGIAHAAYRRDPRDLVILSPIAIWFFYTGFASYIKLSLMWIYAPFLALFGARLAHRLTGNWYHALMPLLLLPAAWTCADHAIANACVPHADTRQDLRAWYRATCPTGEPVAQDPGILIHDAKNPDYYHPLVSSRDLAALKSSGIRYVLTSDEIDPAYHIPPETTRAFREDLARRATLVTKFSPEPGKKAGPTIKVWQLR